MTAPLAAIDQFISEVRSLYPAVADTIERELKSLLAGDDAKSIELSDSIAWILRQQRTALEKLTAISKLIRWDMTARPGTSIMMRELTGW